MSAACRPSASSAASSRLSCSGASKPAKSGRGRACARAVLPPGRHRDDPRRRGPRLDLPARRLGRVARSRRSPRAGHAGTGPARDGGCWCCCASSATARCRRPHRRLIIDGDEYPISHRWHHVADPPARPRRRPRPAQPRRARRRPRAPGDGAGVPQPRPRRTCGRS